MTHASASRDDVRVGFILTTPYQLFHYGPIRRTLTCHVSVFVDVRKKDFGLSRELIEEHMAPCQIYWVPSEDLSGIDGKADVLVCQTPIPVLKFFTRSLVVAQQYSLAKERYQYGIWRSQADLNLMYGEHSVQLTSPFCDAVAAGNPMFDGHVPTDRLLKAPGAPNRGALRVLYMPTYGELANPKPVLDELLAQDVTLTIKAHHADFEIARYAEQQQVPIYFSDTNPIDLIRQNDLVVSDYSGAIYDALALRTPVAITGQAKTVGRDAGRLSSEDLSRSSVSALASLWTPPQALLDVFTSSRHKLSDDAAYESFLQTFYSNFGAAAPVCGAKIMHLATHGPQRSFAADQVRDTTREYIAENRRLRSQLQEIERAGARRSTSKYPVVAARSAARYVVRKMPEAGRALKWAASLALGIRSRRAASGRAAASPQLGQNADAAGLSPLAHMRRLELLDLVSQSLAAGGVDHRTSSSSETAYIAVREEDLDALLVVLRGSSFAAGLNPLVWLGQGAKYSTVKAASAIGIADLAATESLVVGVPYTNGTYSIRRTGGVEVLILAQRGHRLVSRRTRVDKVDWTADFGRTSNETAQLPTSLRSPAAGANNAEDFVDVIYTWVDSSDPEWMRDRDQWSGQTEVQMVSAANDERYLDREELKYSLRSLNMFAPFVRNVYLVTHGHSPSWLAQNDRIRVVPHHEIFPDPTVLPTFNSHSIEASLHRIPGLAENFIYFNDDVFLGREVRFEDFYTKGGLIKSRFSPTAFVAEEEPDPDAIPTDWASYNAARLIREELGFSFLRKLKHVPHPMKRSLLEEMEERFPRVFEETRAARFRSHSDYSIPSMLANFYGVATRRAVEWNDPGGQYVYADTGRWDFQNKLHQIISKSPMFVCLNVTLHSDIKLSAQAKQLETFLAQRYPIPSPFELQAGVSQQAEY